jgi:glycopeptide antibiotics resistance protein
VVCLVVMPGRVYTVGSTRFWLGFAVVMAFGYYLAKSSNPHIWIIKDLLTGFGALIPISVFFLLIKLQETSPAGPTIMPEM